MSAFIANTLLLLALIFCLWRFHAQIRHHGRSSLQKLRSARQRPTRLPCGLDIVLDIFKNSERHTSLQSAVDAYSTYGNTFEQRFMGAIFINTIDAENIKAVTSTFFGNFVMGERRRRASLPLLGLGIFNNEDEQWRHSRRLFRPAFNHSHVRQVDTLFEPHFQSLLTIIPRDGVSFDLSELFRRFSMDVSTQYFFGNCASTLLETETGSSSASTFHNAFTHAQDRIKENYVLGWATQLRSHTQFDRDVEVVWNFVDRFVNQALELQIPNNDSSDSLQSSNSESTTVLEHMIQATTDPVELRSELLHLLLASRDTTSSLLGNLWLVISRNPDIWSKIKKEIEMLARPPTHHELSGCVYLTACIKEGMSGL